MNDATDPATTTIVVVGAGIVGLATARALALAGHRVEVLDKEHAIAQHQTGRNSGVIHAGLYYPPGSLKARMAVAGARSMTAYAAANGIAHDICGKLVVAADERDLPGLRTLAERAAANGVPAQLLTPEQAREHEPYVRCVAALHVETTGIIDYPAVCRSLADDLAAAGGVVRLGVTVAGATPRPGGIRVLTSAGEIDADALVVCAGLYADRVAEACGLAPEARIVPFRGEYFELGGDKHYLVRGLIYPVPDPRFPFLGVHLTRMIAGGVHAGPNAVLALRREGYTWRDVDLAELRESLAWPGLWRLARRNVVPGAREIVRSLSRRQFAASLSRLVPGIEAADLHPAPAGVRAQALRRDGSMVEDFLVQTHGRQVHVLNAPSPAATAALEIADHIAGHVERALAS
ncbi:MAG: L-2-hydroxyglutarate oxidase [Candidatus Phosphoribacter sp.]|nr:L-2-hydroxyglutarate oxidase [Actinomycetales bacterium]